MEHVNLDEFKKEIIEAIRLQTDESIRHTGNAWVEDAVRKITPVAIHETLIKCGIDTLEPLNLQKDFAYLRKTRLDSADTYKALKAEAIRWLIPVIVGLMMLYERYGKVIEKSV